jgi:DNA replication and repair protein RecF
MTVTGVATERPSVSDASGLRAWIGRVSIRDFRNLRRLDLVLPADGLALVGDNGQGKTNFLEALHYLQLLRSFRGAHDQELVSFGAPGFHLAATLHGARAREVSVGFERAGKRKRVRVDGVEPPRLTDALGLFPAVIFSPQDASLVSGPPGVRRRFLDVMLALTSRPYLTALQQYRAALARRNAALRESGVPAARLEHRVAVWEPVLAEHGAVLLAARHAWTEAHTAQYTELCRAIGETGTAQMQYVSAVDRAQGDLATMLRELLEQKRSLDMRRGFTHVGPHRDDLALTLDEHELRTYGSAGQQRTAAIALRLLEAATLRARTGREPVVLLDDPFAELDTRRAGRILELLTEEGSGQTVLAVPREADIPPGLTRLPRWHIASGVLLHTEG